jgi:hypothetical protein
MLLALMSIQSERHRPRAGSYKRGRRWRGTKANGGLLPAVFHPWVELPSDIRDHDPGILPESCDRF